MPKSKVFQRHFNDDWLTDPDFKRWLKKSDLSSDKAFCKVCRKEIRAHIADLRQHAAGAKHQKAISAQHFQPKVSELAKKEIMSEEMKRRKRELRFALFTACKTSFRCIDTLGEIIQDEFGKDKIQLHRTKCTALVKKVLGPFFKDELAKELKDAPFALLADESTDVSVTKLLAFSVRYYSSRFKTIKETFLCLEPIIHADAVSLIVLNLLE